MYKVKRYVVEYERELRELFPDAETQRQIDEIRNAVVTGKLSNLFAVSTLNAIFEEKRAAFLEASGTY